MNLRADLKALLQPNVSLAEYTTMQVGGAAKYFAEPTVESDLLDLIEFAKEEQLPFYILGKGSNTLFLDRGFPGLVIYMGNYEQEKIHANKTDLTLTASGGVHLSRFVMVAREQGLGGAEFLCNVPGTVGGAVMMNAGFSRYPDQKSEIGDLVKSVRVLHRDGMVKEISKENIEFSYRRSNLKDVVILEATLQLWKRNSEDIQKEIRANFDFRNQKQDLRHPSSGSIFKNPEKPNPAAAQLIEKVGFKGKQIGKAMISPKHCNYMINLGDAKSSDIVQLISETQKAVLDATGIHLETEVRIVGES